MFSLRVLCAILVLKIRIKLLLLGHFYDLFRVQRIYFIFLSLFLEHCWVIKEHDTTYCFFFFRSKNVLCLYNKQRIESYEWQKFARILSFTNFSRSPKKELTRVMKKWFYFFLLYYCYNFMIYRVSAFAISHSNGIEEKKHMAFDQARQKLFNIINAKIWFLSVRTKK